MAATMYMATYYACEEITRTFDMAWALDAGLWNLRSAAERYFRENPSADNKEARKALVEGSSIHGLNLHRIGCEFTWEYEEQFVSELLLTNGTAIFDTWVDAIVGSIFSSLPRKARERIADDLKKGDAGSFNAELAQRPISSLAGCFTIASGKRQDAYIDNILKVYSYFKRCRNCCAHGNRQFNDAAEKSYNEIKAFTKGDCGLNEFPEIAVTASGAPLKLMLRGVVGFYDILRRIMLHYDAVASDKVAIEEELIGRWNCVKPAKLPLDIQKRNSSIEYYLKRANMYPPAAGRTNDIYNFLVARGAIVN